MNIDTKGMEVAKLNDQQLNDLLQVEKTINKNAPQEVYILAVTRHD